MPATTLLPSTPAVACCAPITTATLSRAQAEDLARTLKALADPARLRLLSIISSSNGNEACVCDLTDALELGQPTVSHHLKVLTDAGFITRSKRGTWAYYKLEPGALDSVASLIATT